ncbi:hypothetical protein GCM10018980_73390 [Streptomyces capoamus]|uniref:GAF domain-containing protein n=1 Tax=Streptomyces capoamus TaxID=68183 RepID=A0A919F3B9_9ACTN|nr:helix-turn-helix domain-containing protein [Streptomyces capoamus]GGW20721.1 hypothetical protein GCM10010501_68770 [Streptomyces libani subsp. rufus]GHG75762.1 hypothetical protein GCM10018980_73390 [Streptomyces capoamus]
MADEALEILELLKREAPASALTDLIRRARAAGVSERELARLSKAVDLSLGIHALFERRQQREAGLAALVDTARDLTLPYDVDALLKLITRRARLLLALDMSWVTFDDLEHECSRVRAADGHATALTIGFSVPMSGGVGRRAAQGWAPFWSADYLNDDGFTHSPVIDEVVRAEGLQAVMAVPLQHEGTRLGVLYVADRRVRHFTPDEVSLMSSLADLAAVAIEKARLLEHARHEVVELAQDSTRARISSATVQHLVEHHGRLLDLVLRGGGLSALTAEAATGLGGALLVRDTAGRVLAGSAGTAPEPDRDELHTALLDAHAEGRPAATRSGEGRVWVASVGAGDRLLGSLALVTPEPADDQQVRLLALAARTAAVAMLIPDGVAATQGQLRDEFFRRLLRGTPAPPEQIAEQARRLDLDLDSPHVVVVARLEKGTGLRGRVAAWASSYTHRQHGLRHLDGDHVVLLLPGDDPGPVAHVVSKELSEALHGVVTVGSARPVTSPTAIAAAYQEARRCLDAVARLMGPGAAASPDDLGFLGLLLSDQPDVRSFISAAIGPVLDYDEQQYTDLVATLEAYFASASSPSRAAEVLHVHPNTVSRRLERITELLGEGWQKPSRALQVQLALQLQRTRALLTGDRAAQAGHAVR